MIDRGDVGAGPDFDPWPDAALHVEWFPAAARQAAVALIADRVCARELQAAGFAGDVELALQLDVSDAVPVSAGGADGRREVRRW